MLNTPIFLGIIASLYSLSYPLENPMNQTVYILILVSLLILFLINKYEREKLQKILQEQLLKDEAFKASIKEQIQTTENINDVIHAINKDYRLGLLLSKEITDQLK
ncbi:hypothetical protein HMPREF9421_0471 [Streptococcus australis ATCC 700641]|uniref:Uncharacterized protein n=3 Tax=Streptococcus TaxID=1301 RepID=E7S8T5_9STRE|nr:hypothetical protein HMPREF9421_0471 [Streptococcus australis ATCC 700641]